MKICVTGAVLLGCAMGVAAADMPQRKPGLWEIQSENVDKAKAMPPMRQCIDEKTDAELQKNSMQAGATAHADCSRQSFARSGNGWVADSVCKMGETTATTHAVISGDFNSSYSIDSKVHFAPPVQGVADSSHKMSVRWLGPCTGGMKPGDMEVGGHRFNALQMQKMQESMKAGGKMSPEQMKQMMEAMKKQGMAD